MFTKFTLFALVLGMPLAVSHEAAAKPTCCMKKAYCCTIEARCCKAATVESNVVVGKNEVANQVAKPCCAKRAYCCSVKRPCCGRDAANEVAGVAVTGQESSISKPTCCMKRAYCCSLKRSCCPSESVISVAI